MLAYLAAVLLVGALLAPPLFWGARWLVGHGILTFLGRYDFEKYFHRALLVAAIVLLWPLLRALRIKSAAELSLAPDPRRWPHLVAGFLFAAIPLALCAAELVVGHTYYLRHHIAVGDIFKVIGASLVVPIIEETLFRGLILGILLRSAARLPAIAFTSALFSILHFLKTPEHSEPVITWRSGFVSIANSFGQFAEPLLVLAGFTTLFLVGWILADARVRTRSLWMPIGLHAGWILTAGVFNKIAKLQSPALPWIGRSLLIGLVPLAIALLTWWLLRLWLKDETSHPD